MAHVARFDKTRRAIEQQMRPRALTAQAFRSRPRLSPLRRIG
jgi:hypothetical protein